MRLSFLPCVLSVLSLSGLHALEDTLPTLGASGAPADFTSLWATFDPTREPLDTEVLKEWVEDGVVLRVVRYRVGVFKGQKALMAGIYGFPKDGRNLPALLQIHGGGQSANANAVRTNAKRGYATLSIAWAGRLSAPGYEVGGEVVKLFWEGKTSDPNYRLTTDWGALDCYHAPCRSPKSSAAQIAPSEWTLDPVPSPRNTMWYLWTLGARRGLTFLEHQPEVDGQRLGVYGHSMGGKLTVATAGTDRRVKAAAPSCGGISDLTSPDALYQACITDDQYLRRITCPIIFLSPANDFHGRIEDLRPAVESLGTASWRVTCAPHHNHQDTEAYQAAGPLWFDQHLQHTFTYPATPQATVQVKTPSRVPLCTVTPDASQPVTSVEVYYSQQDVPADPKKGREHAISRFWHHAPARPQGATWQADLSVATLGRPLWVYANVRYALDKPVTAAGYYYSTFTATTVNLSSTLQVVSTAQLAAAGVVCTAKPSTTIEAFAEGWEKEWFTYDIPAGWPRRTHKVYDPLFQPPAAGMVLALEVRCTSPNTLVVGLDDTAAVVPLTGGDAWQEVVLDPAAFHASDGTPRSDWANLMELRLGAKDSLRPRTGDKSVTVGGTWTGAAPEFRQLRWKAP